MRALVRSSSRLLVLSALACGGSGGTDNAGVVQIVEVAAHPATNVCGFTSPQTPYTILFSVQMVNTTAEDVTVSSVSSTGVIIRAASEAVVGHAAHTFSTLPFTPSPVVLRARDGERTLSVTMVGSCAQDVTTFKDIQTTLRVTTSAGQYQGEPVTVRVNYN